MRKSNVLLFIGLLAVMSVLGGCSTSKKESETDIKESLYDDISTSDYNREEINSQEIVTESSSHSPNIATFSNSTKWEQEIRYTITYDADKVSIRNIQLGTSMELSPCVLKANAVEEKDMSYPYIGVTVQTPKEYCEGNIEYYKNYDNFKILETGEMLVNNRSGYYIVVEYDFGFDEKRHFKMLTSAVSINEESSVYISGLATYITDICGMSYEDFFKAAYLDIELHN